MLNITTIFAIINTAVTTNNITTNNKVLKFAMYYRQYFWILSKSFMSTEDFVGLVCYGRPVSRVSSP